LKLFFDVLSHLKGIQDVGVFVSKVFLILTFFGQTGDDCQSYNCYKNYNMADMRDGERFD